MLAYLDSERRDYQPAFDIVVVGEFIWLCTHDTPFYTSIDIPEQAKMTLKVDIKYKSNWQQGALKGMDCIFVYFVPDRVILARRRNKWICALKSAMTQVKMFGPSGDPTAKGVPTPYTLVPWEEVKDGMHQPRVASPSPGGLRETNLPKTWSFTDHNAMLGTWYKAWGSV